MTAPVQVLCYEAFAAEPGKGNPSGVVLDARGLSELEMQSIATQAGYAETVFVLPSGTGDLRLRYFTPGHEMDLCGHGTIAAFYAMQKRNLLPSRAVGHYRVETRAGVLPIVVDGNGLGAVIRMRQPSPRFVPFEGSRELVCDAIGIGVGDLHPELPLVYGNTGIWTLVVPVRGLDVMARMKPSNADFPAALVQMPRVSIHPMCLQTQDPKADMHARHFSSPFSGTVEDVATGTASGVLGGYYDAHVAAVQDNGRELCIEQGLELGFDARIHVRTTGHGSGMEVEIAGTACLASERRIASRVPVSG